VGFPELLFIFCFVVIGLLGTAFWIWMLVDCATKEPDTGNTKVVWILIIALAHLIGAAVYYFVRRPERMELVGR
jgi:sterol desaturase/sphingolipid hydroxylase (fatty acid hydroxylase superfamily)